MGRSHDVVDWDPDDTAAWEAGNKNIARRNLIWSVATATSLWLGRPLRRG